MNSNRWEVLTLFGHTWENCWSDDGKPVTFRTRSEARAELREMLQDCHDAVKRGDMSDAPSRSNFRIARVQP